GVPHPATVLVTGAGGLSLTPAPVYSCGHAPIDVADSGCIASYTYPGDANHTGSAGSQTYSIGARAASVTPNPATKFVGTPDPVPLTAGTFTGFVASDLIVASYARNAGETLAGSPYPISATLSPTGILANFNITYYTASFYIVDMSVTGPIDPLSKGTLSSLVVT